MKAETIKEDEMAKTVVGLFNTQEEANNVVQDLVSNGFSRDAISVVSQNATTDASIAVGDTAPATGAGVGAGLGAATGGLFGLLVGLGVLVIPGIGPVLAAGPLAAAIGTAAAAVGGAAVGAVGGAAVGGLLGALVDAGVPEEEAHLYAEGVRRGGTLVMVNASDTLANRAHSIMARHNAIDIDERSTEWRKAGWERFDSTGTPVSRTGDKLGQKWEESSKVGTVGGALAGAATGAAAGSAAGPVGTVAGGAVGAAVGAGLGAGADAAAEGIEDETFDPDTPAERARANARGTAVRDTITPAARAGNKLGQKWEESSKVGTAGGAVAGAATGAAAGAIGGPAGAVAGGVAGAVVGAGLGAAADAAAEGIEDETFDPDTPAERARANARGARVYSPPDTYESDTNGFSVYDNDFRTHYQTHYANSGYTYDQYLATYRYGYNLANDAAYTGRDWTYVEPEARRRWEERNPNSWEHFKDAIQYAWDRVRGVR